MGLRLTAREALQRAEELGHHLYVREITEPEVDGRWTRGVGMQGACSCGWREQRSWKSRKAVSAALTWHMGKVVADELERQDRESRAAGRPGVPSAP